MMKSYLKTASVVIESLGEPLELRELSARGQMDLLELHRSGKQNQTAAMVAKHGVPAWEMESVETIENSVPARALGEIAVAVYKLSGIDVPTDKEIADAELAGMIGEGKKNASEIGPNGASFSGSPHT